MSSVHYGMALFIRVLSTSLPLSGNQTWFWERASSAVAAHLNLAWIHRRNVTNNNGEEAKSTVDITNFNLGGSQFTKGGGGEDWFEPFFNIYRVFHDFRA